MSKTDDHLGGTDDRLLSSVTICFLALCATANAADSLTLSAGTAKLTIARDNTAISLEWNGAMAAPAHPQGGLLLGEAANPEVARVTGEEYDARGHLVLLLATESGKRARATVTLTPNQADFVVEPSEPEAVLLRLGGASPGFGLGDHAVTGRDKFDTDVTGYRNEKFLSGQGSTRMVSNFVIYPKQKFAFLIWDPGMKIVRSTTSECTQGARRAEGPVRFTIFAGTPHDIYRGFLESRDLYGFPVLKPKYEFFGVGWEAFGALAWDTSQKTVKDNVDHYLSAGYPLAWMVVGSGFWPHAEERLHETTSFGLYDKTLYPDPAAFIAYFHSRGLKFFQGLRTTFITDGPFAAEGVHGNYFVEEAGKPRVMQFGWPKSPIYFLDWTKPQAVDWFAGLVSRWTSFGVDGFKEDVYGFGKYELGDDKLDPVNYALMREGLYIMGRNAYLGSYFDLHRINDFNYDQNQDRGPVNSLALAYSGLPLIYPDIVGGTFGEQHFDLKVTPRMRTYMMRNAQWAAVHCSMSMGQGPWTFGDPKLEKVMLEAARLHDRLQPYLYSQAVRFYLDGYPWTMAPLPVAFPDDPAVYGRENQKVRGFEWMIGDALLAAPLYGNDFETAETRDVYLPAGDWIDYDTGTRYHGPKMLQDYALPVGKTPLFVGGTGIVIEKRGSELAARIFPVTQHAETFVIARDGLTRTTIRLNVADWKNVTLRGGKARGTWQHGVYEFVITPGETYELR